MTEPKPAKIPKTMTDATVDVTTNENIVGLVEEEKKAIVQKIEPLTDSEVNAFEGPYIHLQNERSVEIKLHRQFKVGDPVVLVEDFLEELMFRGYCCNIIGISGNTYEIAFEASFSDNSPSPKSQQQNPNFEFPDTHYVATVPRDAFVRVEFQDLYYRTHFY